jgi:DNA-binding CsgD family transcriptional regulator
MEQLVDDRSQDDEHLEQIVAALKAGIILVDSSGRIAWMDEITRSSVNGGLHDLALPVRKPDRSAIDCFVSAVDVTVGGERKALCVIQQSPDQKESGFDVVAAVEAVMADTSWFTRTIIDKLKAFRHTTRPAAPSSDLDLLTDREREILALICEGRSDVDMSRMLGLSQNTVRNHVASLYRKIGVNRRSAAIIWARERAITSQEVLGLRARRRARPDRQGQRQNRPTA